jgi:ATP-dependent Clp protease ATP-binding subunit ClpA
MMFERFTRQARAVVVGAQRHAETLRHPGIGTEHLLLALVDDEGGAGAVLRAAGLTPQRTRDGIQRRLGTTSDPLAALGEEDAAALRAIGIDLEAVRAKVEDIFGPGSLQPPPKPERRRTWGGLPFTRRAKKVIELSLREAIALRDTTIGSEHILLGLLRDGGGLAAEVLADEGLDAAALRRDTLDTLRRVA